jgi:uncharacterized phage protein gp47/JayE
MADYPIASIDELTRRGLELTRALLPELDTSPGGVVYRDVRATAALVADNTAHTEAVDRDALPTTAEGAALERWGAFRDVERKGATTATGVDALACTGTPGAVVAVGLVLQDQVTGIQLETTSPATLSADGSGVVSVETIATTASGTTIGVGSQANLALGSALLFLAPPLGVDQNALLIKPLVGGEDVETDGAYRARVVNRFSQPPQGGNRNDFEQWILLVTGIDSGYPLSRRNGIGTVDLTGLRDGQGIARIPSGAQLADIASTVAALQPLGVDSRVITPVAQVVDVVVLITGVNRPEYAFDFDDPVSLAVLTYDAPSRIVETDNPLPSGFGPGDRIVFADDGRVFLVGAIVSETEFVLASENPEDLTYVPAPSTNIWAGGALTEPVRQAILNGYLAADGSRIPGINQLGPANEEDRYQGGWIDTVEVGRVVAAALSVPGVYRAVVGVIRVDGVALEDEDIARPSDPAVPGALPEETTTIGVLVAGEIRVINGSGVSP